MLKAKVIKMSKKDDIRAERLFLYAKEARKNGYIEVREVAKKYGHGVKSARKNVQILARYGIVRLNPTNWRYEVTGIFKLRLYLNELAKVVCSCF